MLPIHTTTIAKLELLRRGKVRDVYRAGEDLLMVVTDRISAFDVVMNEAIPDKGALLTAISKFWFETLRAVVPNHMTERTVDDIVELTDHERDMLRHRSMVVQRTNPLPIECVVRGYLSGSGWKEYQSSGTVCGVALPSGLVESDKLPEPIFTPATKAEEGHDENITFEQAAAIVGTEVAERVRRYSFDLYNAAAAYVADRGLILADTKFEFGVAASGDIILIDEALTPDSSRYWLAADYQPGQSQHNFDKQVLRDWLETLTWNKQPPPPPLPQSVVLGTRAKYIEAYERITGRQWHSVHVE
jgi:phosphoribosylaminoimidazole-succinocarboxamide synthase